MSRNVDFNKFLVFDGAMGTMLQACGMKAGELSERYNIEKPEVIEKIHRAYIDAGADVITTNTFGANRYKLNDTGLNLNDVITRAVEVATKAAKDKLVALDVGPLGQLMEPYGSLSFEEAYEAFKEQVLAGALAGADIIIIETMSDIYEAKAAILAARENSNLPIICTMTFQEDGRTLTGTDPLTMVNILQNLGIAALGINCSLGPKEMMPLVHEVLKYSRIPVIVQPNAGLPKMAGSETIFEITPEMFAAYGRQMAEAGVRILGGCCGTTPEHIRELKNALIGLKPVKTHIERITAASSSTCTVTLGGEVKIIGERINPTGKKKLKEALMKDDMDYILREAVDQKDNGAHILDVNVGIPEMDEETVMVRAIKEIQGIVNLPLQIDSVKPKVIEAGVRVCNGRPIINSVNGEDKVMETIFPIVKKYGCLVVALTLDDGGIPKTAEERLKIAEKIIKRAGEYGIPKEDIIVDCLVLTASAQQKEVKETIRAVRLVKEKLGVMTTLGVSNVSFGLPARSLLNRTFLAAALSAGLDAPIMNPMDADMRDTVRAFNVLWNHDKDSKEYINAYADSKAKPENNDNKTNKDLKKIIIDGLKEEVKETVREFLKEFKALEIVDNYLIPALDIVGEKYEKGEIFLPQLILSAETVKNAFEVIKEDIMKNSSHDRAINKGNIVIATVKGDIHDIGKNIAKILLENYGFQVYDLGKDVPTEKIVGKVKEVKAPLVGLSALMTTTVQSMEETIKALKLHCPDCVVMAGGAVLNENYANMIGADFYVKDARDSVKVAEMVINGVKKN
ncbi:homocysteine S-methyltransferase family protein [Lutispora thermophila]|uniref:Methionine synthase n=1 Tax=Lutispora thermophila DSM 19022 TaxID=1122184 RepID=A0A1M6EG53_9FIRM|nr:homocysteine S-methyltransferase family protein [Lutispora thermophila]SHI84466.1 5-methyltetrahydrofolate--homocysteine methyltransferase [Lutispora thermophila DSM 19022]